MLKRLPKPMKNTLSRIRPMNKLSQLKPSLSNKLKRVHNKWKRSRSFEKTLLRYKLPHKSIILMSY